MRSKSLNISLIAGVPLLVYSCPLTNFHNVTISSGTNSVYIGDSSIVSGVGIPLNINDVINFSVNDFQKLSDKLEIWAVCAGAASLNLLAWEM